ncbi:MAG: hypothetical protein MJY82_01775 [Fibrobacter sp.]|nr:hypothetical protein [Fibrobacter sp.]
MWQAVVLRFVLVFSAFAAIAKSANVAMAILPARKVFFMLPPLQKFEAFKYKSIILACQGAIKKKMMFGCLITKSSKIIY